MAAQLQTTFFTIMKIFVYFRLESLDLYLAACQFDPDLIPFTAKGPTLTPPIKEYIQVSLIQT